MDLATKFQGRIKAAIKNKEAKQPKGATIRGRAGREALRVAKSERDGEAAEFDPDLIKEAYQTGAGMSALSKGLAGFKEIKHLLNPRGGKHKKLSDSLSRQRDKWRAKIRKQ